jgi:RNA polymerase sigma-70 factor (ECF subfamily)
MADTKDHGLRGIYEEHYDFVWRSVLRLGCAENSADDAVHDVFLVVARRLAEFEGRSTIKTWLFAIAVRVVQRHKRDLARHLRRVDAVAGEGSEGAKDAHARSEAAELLHRLLAELDEEKRIAFILSELEGMTAREIGEAFGVKEATIHSRIRAAREKLSAAAEKIRVEGGA